MTTHVPPTGLRLGRLPLSEHILLLGGFISSLDFPGGEQPARHAVEAARRTAALKSRLAANAVAVF